MAQLEDAINRGKSAFNMLGGEQLRDYLPLETVALHLVLLLENISYNGVVNICSGKPILVHSLMKEFLAKRVVNI